MRLKKKRTFNKSNDVHHIAYCNPGAREDAIRFELVIAIPEKRIPVGYNFMNSVIRFVCRAVFRVYLFSFFTLYFAGYLVVRGTKLIVGNFSQMFTGKMYGRTGTGNTERISERSGQQTERVLHSIIPNT